MRVGMVLAFALTACGRLSFDPIGPGASGDAGGDSRGIADAARDAPAAGRLVSRGVVQGAGGSLTIANLALDAGATLIVVTNRDVQDTGQVLWGSQLLGEDLPVGVWGPGPMFTSIWSLYITTSGIADLVSDASGVSSGHMLAFVAQGLPPASFDQSAESSGTGGVASSGGTGITATPTELVFAMAGGDFGDTFTASWGGGVHRLRADVGPGHRHGRRVSDRERRERLLRELRHLPVA